MVSLPLVFAPLRALIGFRSDTHRSVLGWRRVPYIWFGTLLQFGGLAIMPFALMVLSGDTHGPPGSASSARRSPSCWSAPGMHTVQTVGLALATDLAPPKTRSPRRGLALRDAAGRHGRQRAASSALLLARFQPVAADPGDPGRAAVTMVLNIVALWKQEARDPSRTRGQRPSGPASVEVLASFAASGRASRRLVAVGLGTAAFTMQDVLLEPYGGQILRARRRPPPRR